MADHDGAEDSQSPSNELDAALRDTELELRALHAKRARILSDIKASGTHTESGHRSLGGYLRSTCNVGGTTAKKDQTLAALVADHPRVADSLEAGHISVDHAHEIARIHTNPRIRHMLDAVLDSLLEIAEHLSWGEFRIQVGTLIGLADQDGAFKEQQRNEKNRSAWVDDMSSTLHLSASGGDPMTAAQVVAIYETFVNAELAIDLQTRRAEFGDAAEQHPLPRTQPQRNFDALVRIFTAAAGSPEASKLPEPTVNILIDQDTLHDAFASAGLMLPNGNQIELDDEGRVADPNALMADLLDELCNDPDSLSKRKCTLSTGAPIHPIVALQALVSGHVRRVVLDSRSVITDLGARSRVFTGSARDAALLLSTYCEHNGCTIRARHGQVDHMLEWSDGGRTDQSNAQARCGPHNRFKHREGWRTKRDEAGRTYDVKPDGTIVLPVGERPPDLTAHDLIERARERVRKLAATPR